MKLNELEILVIREFLKSEKVNFSEENILSLRLKERAMTGCGFIAELLTPLELNCKEQDSPRGDVRIMLNDNILTGYQFYINDSKLWALEGYTYSQDWPSDIRGIRVLKKDKMK